MFAGTEDMFPALIGMVRAIFGAFGIDAKHREVHPACRFGSPPTPDAGPLTVDIMQVIACIMEA